MISGAVYKRCQQCRKPKRKKEDGALRQKWVAGDEAKEEGEGEGIDWVVTYAVQREDRVRVRLVQGKRSAPKRPENSAEGVGRLCRRTGGHC